MGLAVAAAAGRLPAALAPLPRGGGPPWLARPQACPPRLQHAPDFRRVFRYPHGLSPSRLASTLPVRSFPYWKNPKKPPCEEKSSRAAPPVALTTYDPSP